MSGFVDTCDRCGAETLKMCGSPPGGLCNTCYWEVHPLTPEEKAESAWHRPFDGVVVIKRDVKDEG